MSFNLPSTIQTYWQTNANLPTLWLEYLPEPLNVPVAVLEATGFSRDYISAGMKQDTFNYKISIITSSAETTWTQAEAAMLHMESLTNQKIVTVSISPDNMAKPAQVGQVDVWVFEFSVDVQIFDN
jgi:hypothetical protein